MKSYSRHRLCCIYNVLSLPCCFFNVVSMSHQVRSLFYVSTNVRPYSRKWPLQHVSRQVRLNLGPTGKANILHKDRTQFLVVPRSYISRFKQNFLANKIYTFFQKVYIQNKSASAHLGLMNACRCICYIIPPLV